MSDQIAYIRNRATGLREQAAKSLDPEVRQDYTSGARYLDLVADELEHEFHV